MRLILKKAIQFLLIASFFFITPFNVFAAPYGSGPYGGGAYNVGATATPTPTPTPTPSSGGTSGGSSGGSSGGGSGEGPCSATKPASAPDLFQINAATTSVTLYFAPSIGPRDRYYISYGLRSGAEQYGFELINNQNGVVSVQINALAANTDYYFKVRAGNGCMPGDWSNELSINTSQRFPSYRWTSLSSLQHIVRTATSKKTAPTTTVTAAPESAPETTPMPTSPAPQKVLTTPRPTTTAQPQQPTTSPSNQPEESFWQKVVNFFSGLIK